MMKVTDLLFGSLALAGMTLLWIAIIAAAVFVLAVWVNLPGSPLGKQLHDRAPRAYRFLTGTDEWDEDFDV